FNYLYCKAFLAYIFGEFASADASVRANERHATIAGSAIWAGQYTLLDSLCRLSAYEGASEDERARIREVVEANRARLARWLPHCPRSYEHRLCLIEAELARALGRDEDARTGLARAVELARKSGYLHEEAMACELAARFHLD